MRKLKSAAVRDRISSCIKFHLISFHFFPFGWNIFERVKKVGITCENHKVKNAGTSPTTCHILTYSLSYLDLHLVISQPTACHISPCSFSHLDLQFEISRPTVCHFSTYSMSYLGLQHVISRPTACDIATYSLSYLDLQFVIS